MTTDTTEQKAIGDCLDSIAARTARAVSRARAQISCMHEYRTRLITDVVTGKLDVREANLPEELDLPTCPVPTGLRSKRKL